MTVNSRSRRRFVADVSMTLAGAAGALLGRCPSEASTATRRSASRAIFLFMNGGPSHIDTFDPKPELARYDGSDYTGPFAGSPNRPGGKLWASRFRFRQHGDSGLPISELFPHLARHADDLCVIRSMHGDTPLHGSGVLQMNTGSMVLGRPSVGSWVAYGLGSLQEDLPTFVVLPDARGGPISGSGNWSAGFLPGKYAGTMLRPEGEPILHTTPPPGTSSATQARVQQTLERLEQVVPRRRSSPSPGRSSEDRMESYRLAFRLQHSAVEAVDLGAESRATRQRYGLDDPVTSDFGRRLLLARRMLERGVRFVQVYSGGGKQETNWDSHTYHERNHRQHAAETDRPIAALLEDLHATGLWDETLVLWSGEFGRTPTREGSSGTGRDHNPHGFSAWLAGGPVRGGQAIGATDEWGFGVAEKGCHICDLHATVLHLLGLDPEGSTYRHDGLEQRLIGFEPRRVFTEVMK